MIKLKCYTLTTIADYQEIFLLCLSVLHKQFEFFRAYIASVMREQTKFSAHSVKFEISFGKFVVMRLFIIFGVLIKLCNHFANANNYFTNVICGKTISESYSYKIDNLESYCLLVVKTSKEIDEIFSRFRSGYQFSYQECKYVRHSHQCEQKRSEWSSYTGVSIMSSNLSRLSFNDYEYLAQKKFFDASQIGLLELNRDDLKSLKGLENLDFSFNNITILGNMVLRFAQALKFINLSHNQIESIHVGAFDECSPVLEKIDLSYNKLTLFPANILDAVSSNTLSLNLANNQIDEISTPLIKKIWSFSKLDLSYNNLKNFTINCDQIDVLLLNDNQLATFSTPNCTVDRLSLSNNQLTELDVAKISSLSLSRNIRLKKLTISDASDLDSLMASDLNANVITMETLRNSTQMENLDLSGTFLGPLQFDTFAEMNMLKVLRLKNTGISRIDYGMLGHQRNLTLLDVSFNNLGSIDLHVLTNLKNLETLDISGNNLTQIQYFESLSQIFPNLKFIGIDQNDFNCTYLAMIIKSLNEKDIIILDPIIRIKSSTHINGIGCTAISGLKVKPLDNVNDETSKKLNEIIEQINAEKTRNENDKTNADLLQTQVFHIRNEMFDIKTKISNIQMSGVAANGSVDFNDIRKHIELVSNLTLEKQKLASEQLSLRISEVNLEIAKLKNENDKVVQNLKVLSSSDAQNSMKSQQMIKENDGGHSTTIILLTITITSLVIVAVAFMYVKFKDLLKLQRAYSGNLGVRARSTNTINTTVEMPFDDRHQGII